MPMHPLLRFGLALQAVMLTAGLAGAQESYLRAQGGYALGIFPQSFATMGVSQGHASRTEKAALGEGWSAGLAYGYMFTDHLGVELGAGYFGGAAQSFGCACMDGTTTGSTFQTEMIQAMPSLVLRGSTGALQPYMRLGAVIGFGAVVSTSTHDMTDQRAEEEWRYYGGVSFGMAASAGVLYELGEQLSIFAELQYIGATYTPERGELTSARRNGEDIRPTLTTSEKEIVFTDEYLGSDALTPPGNQPTDEPRRVQRLNYKLSSVGIQIGLLWTF